MNNTRSMRSLGWTTIVRSPMVTEPMTLPGRTWNWPPAALEVIFDSKQSSRVRRSSKLRSRGGETFHSVSCKGIVVTNDGGPKHVELEFVDLFGPAVEEFVQCGHDGVLPRPPRPGLVNFFAHEVAGSDVLVAVTNQGVGAIEQIGKPVELRRSLLKKAAQTAVDGRLVRT